MLMRFFFSESKCGEVLVKLCLIPQTFKASENSFKNFFFMLEPHFFPLRYRPRSSRGSSTTGNLATLTTPATPLRPHKFLSLVARLWTTCPRRPRSRTLRQLSKSEERPDRTLRLRSRPRSRLIDPTYQSTKRVAFSAPRPVTAS